MPKVSQKEKKIVGRFRVLRGSHNEHGKKYRKGDIVESTSDLLKHNHFNGRKFARADEVILDESAETSDSASAFSNMTIEELQGYASEGDVSLSGASSKADIIKRIQESENE